MNVILLERLRNLGDLGDEVSVKNGFARNFLIPQGKAVRATQENREHFESRREELERAANDRLTAAETRARSLADLSVTIPARAGDEGRLYGSVGTREIADAIEGTGVEVNKSEIKLPEGAIRQTGEYEVDIQLHSDVIARVQVLVVPE